MSQSQDNNQSCEVASPALHKDAIEGGTTVPSTVPLADRPALAESKNFPNCGHTISGVLYKDFLDADRQDCPNSFMRFGSCGHAIMGQALRQALVSRTNECPVCTPPSNSVACDAHLYQIEEDLRDVHTERSRVTLHRYQDPLTFDGATCEFYKGKDGRPRLRVESEVWKSWSRSERERFVYCTNVRLGLPAGDRHEAPTNPKNLNHPEHTLLQPAGSMRLNSRGKPDPEAAAAAIRQLLATSDKDVAASVAARKSCVDSANQPAGGNGDAKDVVSTQSQELVTANGDGTDHVGSWVLPKTLMGMIWEIGRIFHKTDST
ncbi:hypothetical protein KVR01_003898 [Diaporthe batatas]|uniref:uncharacterized protein n=1 Tax=Diaporthe batatas TaxID=748121 RepID=UPI001D03C038|nr:uncharacterized protein KVR01_003898 [Diaporthe batatas]KAG8168209.1 hypothetical protein KVR01_003898 [Diaporthe batatas]